MLTQNDILVFLRENKKYFYDHFHVTKIALIGSFAKNEYNEQSDIDLLIDFRENTPDLFDLKLELKDYIRRNIGREADLCREKYIKPYIKNIIVHDAIYV